MITLTSQLLSNLRGYGIYPRSLSSILLGYGDPVVAAENDDDDGDFNPEDYITKTESESNTPPLKRQRLEGKIKRKKNDVYSDVQDTLYAVDKDGLTKVNKLIKWVTDTVFDWKNHTSTDIRNIITDLVKFVRITLVAKSKTYREFLLSMDKFITRLPKLLGKMVAQIGDYMDAEPDERDQYLPDILRRRNLARETAQSIFRVVENTGDVTVIDSVAEFVAFILIGLLSDDHVESLEDYLQRFSDEFEHRREDADLRFSDDIEGTSVYDDLKEDEDLDDPQYDTRKDKEFVVPDDVEDPDAYEYKSEEED